MTFDKPVILQVLPALNTGGVERGTVEMAQAILNADGIALIASADGVWKQSLQRMGAIHIQLPLHSKNPLVIWKNQFALKKIIEKYNVDIVHVRSRAPAWSAWLAVKNTKVHFITTWHGVFSENWCGKRWYNQVMTKGERVIAISHYIAERLKNHYGVSEQILRIIPRGVDLNTFDPELSFGDRVTDLAEKWQIPATKKIILLPGRLTAWKGQELLVRAMAMIKRHHADWICVFVGPSKHNDQFIKRLLLLADQLQVREQLYFVGNCQDMPAAFMLANIVVVPSIKPEPFGRVVIEAQAMEKPVIVANHGGAAETVIDKKTGYVFEPGNVKALAELLQELVESSDEDLHWTGRLAREDAQAHYALTQMQAATLNVYNEVLPQTKQLRVS
ncbi:Glycosyltransferase involved in cell wall bisynthesis (RfaB) (PDB:2IV7) [Commensalibacter communis]|uniref:glycosyltransferase family 4 protein n=1 Tax=Commensalibacter communis TaxID=2972786 RepID=UPI0022FF97F4|nr:glycosyltransferase family 4 protein [Commensalibacter communis]CAI3927430.1 Glycosyltransferase involved in cell wall bisynthesis (RfaB) (PDB:2IV7) [Commensalibacter communis]CAI3931903.1 Glycosyltransferase involved in cell wall bisynthesis (RfaB) (PDB:2IV7) [Commensalibacter communis]